MKFYCDTDKLNSALSLVSKAVEANAVSPHLEGILFHAKGGTLQLKGNNMEICIETAIPCNIVEEGKIIINCKMICDIVRKLPKDVVEFVMNEKNIVSISCLNSEYMVVGLPGEEYPDLPEITPIAKMKLSSPVLKDMINKTIFSINTNPDEVRKVLKGSLFETENSDLTIVSVDLVRLAMIKKPLLEEAQNTKFIVPGKTLNELKNMLNDNEDNIVNITVGKNQALFDTGIFKLTTRLIDGEFFSYKQIIPKQFKVQLNVDTQDFIKTIERVEPIIDKVSQNPIRLTFTDGKIKVKCETQLGKVNDLVECDYSYDEMVIGFNYKYIHDAVIRCEDDEIQLKFNSPLNPIIINSPQDDSYLFMVLPVRL